MAKVVSPLTARVEVIGKPKESSFNPGIYYYPTLFIDLAAPKGSESAKIWKNLSGDEVSQILKGDVVQLVPAGQDKSGKPKHNIVLLQEAPPKPQPIRPVITPSKPQPARADPTAGLTPDQKRAIAAYIDSQADLYRYCLQTAKTKLEGLASSESVLNDVATSLYLSAIHTFQLEKPQ